jgi:undecaprenyl-diphosphatase
MHGHPSKNIFYANMARDTRQWQKQSKYGMLTGMQTAIIFCVQYMVYIGMIAAVTFFIFLPRAEQKRLALYGIIALPVTYIVAKLLALLYDDPRPFVVGHFAPLVAHAADNGFPSDHTLLLAALASVFYPYSKKASWTIWAITLVVGFSRVAAGIHHAIDIIGAIAIAIVVCRGIYALMHPRVAVAPGASA